MCNFWSCILTKDMKVLWDKDKTSHESLVKANHLKDDKLENRERDRAATKRFIHGTPEFAEVFAAMWAEQDGKCYLCAEPLVPGRTTHVEHDHSCCPRGRTCAVCRRGLACERCNHIVGQAHDNPELLRRIADNFEPVLIATRARIAAKTADQLSLWEEEAS